MQISFSRNVKISYTLTCNDGYEFASFKVVDINNSEIKLSDNNKFSKPNSEVKIIGVCKFVEKENKPVEPEPNETSIEIVIPEEKDVNVPRTSDNIIKYVIMLIISLITLIGVSIYLKKSYR